MSFELTDGPWMKKSAENTERTCSLLWVPPGCASRSRPMSVSVKGDQMAKSAKSAKKAKKAPARKANAAFMKPVTPSPQLAEIVGTKPIPRTEVTKKLWAYIKKNGLQDQKNKRMIKADGRVEDRVRRQGHRQHVRDDEAGRQASEIAAAHALPRPSASAPAC